MFREKHFVVEIFYRLGNDEIKVYRGLYKAKTKRRAKDKAIDFICFNPNFRGQGAGVLWNILLSKLKKCLVNMKRGTVD